MEDPEKTKAWKPPEEEPKDSQGRVGTVLAGRYRILRLLGEGAQGAVYVGEHLRIGRKDAIKVLQPALLDDEDAVARFRRGASKASHINHPNVCTVYDFGETEDGLPFMASELVDGKELHDVLRTDAPMQLERAVDLLDQIAAALTAAHELNIVHRDLKPANVMLTRGRRGREKVKVVDFDIAKGIGEAEAGGGLTQAGWIIGTPQYMSPEQITASDIDARSDIYSLGLIFFEMVTGKLPNDVGSTQKLMWQRVSGELKRLDQAHPRGRFPAGLQAALDRALAREPDDRPASAIDFAREVREALEAAPPASEDELATAVAAAPDLDATRGARTPPEVPATRAADDEPGPVPPTRPAAPDAAPGGEGAVPSTRVADETPAAAGSHEDRKPTWASFPVLAGAAGVGVVAVVAVAWAISSGGEPPVLASMPDAPLAFDVGGTPILLDEVRLVEADGDPVQGASLSFLSRDPSIARTDGYQISPVGPGETWVVVSAGDVTDSVRVTVGERVAGGGDVDTGDEEEGGGGTRSGDTGERREERQTPPEGGERGTTQRDADDPGTEAGERRVISEEEVTGMWQTILRDTTGLQQFTEEERRSFREDAQAAFDQQDLPAATRARAAWVMAQFFAEGTAEYCHWANRALDLEPDYGPYQALAQPCDG